MVPAREGRRIGSHLGVGVLTCHDVPMALLSVDELVQQAVTAAAAEINQRSDLPTVHHTRFRVGEDSGGEGGVWIWLVLDDPAAGSYPRPVQDALREIILKHLRNVPGTGFALVASVYLSFQRKSEYDASRQWRGDPDA